jgi:hypothetical protein
MFVQRLRVTKEAEGLVQRLRARVKAERRRRRFSALDGAEESFYSQNGEDGILRELLFRVGFEKRYFVEFGAGDGRENNTALLAQQYGWGGVYIEGDPSDAAALTMLYESNPAVRVLNERITRENIGKLFARAAIPAEFDLLSIDIDGNDYWVWSELQDYRSRVVVVEYNAAFVPPRRWVMAYNPEHRWDGTKYFGASLESYALLGRRLGYELVGTESRGVNAFFVRADLLSQAKVRPVTPAEAYRPLRYGVLRRSHPAGPERPHLVI